MRLRTVAALPIVLVAESAAAQGCWPGWWPTFASGELVTNYDGGALAVFDSDGPGPLPPALFAADVWQAGGLPATGLARWDGVRWTDVGANLGWGLISALVVFDADGAGPALPMLIVGGYFDSIGGLNAGNIAAWDGTHWWNLGSGTDDGVDALAIFDPDGDGPQPAVLCAGGWFDKAGDVDAHQVALWNGSQWSALGDGVSPGVGTVHAICTFDEDGTGPDPARLFVGGGTFSGGVSRWDGSHWTTVGGGLAFRVNDLAVFDEDGDGPLPSRLFASGDLQPGDVARWDGNMWKYLAGYDCCDEVQALGVWDDDGPGPHRALLYAGASIDDAHTGPASWDGSNWTVIAPGAKCNAGAIVPFDHGSGESLYFEGRIASVGGVDTRGIARWDGQAWHALGNGANAPARALTIADLDGPGPLPARLYVAGDFTTMGGGAASHFAVFDGQRLSGLSDGLDAGAYTVAAYDEDGDGPNPPALFVGGLFKNGGHPYIARWDGSQWTSVGDGLNGPVWALTVHDLDGPGPGRPSLYAGGMFIQSGETAAYRVARWNGKKWSPVGGGVNNLVRTLLSFDADGEGPALPLLIAGGAFTQAGKTPVNHIAAWDGSSWAPLGDGADDQVWALAPYDTIEDGQPLRILAAGGDFTHAGGQPASHIAAWHDGQWAPLGSGTDATVRALSQADTDGPGANPASLWVGGDFQSAGGLHSPYLARWDGEQWRHAGQGSNGPVRALASGSGAPGLPPLIAAGDFTEIDGIPSARFAVLGCPPCAADFDGDGQLTLFDFLAYVNAFNTANPAADCDASGGLDLFDFLCFINAFNAGC